MLQTGSTTPISSGDMIVSQFCTGSTSCTTFAHMRKGADKSVRESRLNDSRHSSLVSQPCLPHTGPLCLGVSGPGIAELRSVACRVAS
jgi:hypothetical protein